MPITIKEDPDASARWLGYARYLSQQSEGRRELMARFPSPSAVLREAMDPRLGAWRAGILSEPPVRLDPMENDAWLLAFRDPHYSALLAECNDAPPCLMGMGDTSVFRAPAISIVGTRRPSVDGQKLAEQFAFELARAGFVVVSGLARGIDAAAHRGALAAGGKTIAVMATGIDTIYPRTHAALARDIAKEGALVTQFFPGSAPLKHHFPRRNRTISGLSLATVVIEAGKPSGSLITAIAAAEQGRDVYALPWSVRHDGGRGCLHLLLEGAALATSVEDVIRGTGWVQPQKRPTDTGSGRAVHDARYTPDSRQIQLLQLIGDGCHSAVSLAQLLSVDISVMNRWLITMEIEGLLTREAQGYQKRAPSE